MEVPNFKKSRLSQLISHGLIISGRGGSKGGGGARTPVEANDTVNSRAMASVLDLLGEGVIGGLVDGAKSILLNDTPLQNADGSYNFSGVTWWFRDGSQDQSVIDGFDFIETPKSVGRQLKQTSQVNVSLDSADSDRVRVVMKFPSLRSIDKKSGDTNGTTVQFKFQIDAGNGGGFVDVVAEGESSATISLTAKKTGVYYRSYVLDLPKPAKAYTLRAIRLTEDHNDNSYLYDDSYVDSIGEIVNTSLNYPNSALVGLKINSEQFGSTMPSRSYLIKGLKIRVPSNYNADTNSYDGNWDGTFKLASSSNPAWILFDLLTNTRYGLGQFVQESMINIGELYQIGRYCDAFVDDGFGGKEKRFAINTQITSRQDAYRVVQDIAGAFRGMVYWAGGMVHITQDSPADPVMLFSNSNVVNGSFAYKGSARKDRYSVALITYNNKEDGYKQSVEYVEDQEAIKRYGVRKTESVAFGCTSRGQAHRVGLWTLYTSRMESDVITFAVGMDSVFLMPGDIVLIADKFRAGRRNSGRITGYTYNSIKLDAPVDLTSVGNHITFLSAEGKMVERDILENGKNITTVTFKTALSSNEIPVNDAVWVIAQPDLTPLQARVVSVTEGDDGTSFNITAIQNNPTKYEAIDSGAQLIPQNTTVLDPTFSKPSGLTITEGTYLSSPGNLSVSLTAAWQGKSAQYYVSWRRSDEGNVSNWQSQRVTEEQFELRGVAENGQYDFQVYAVSVGGRKTDPINITYKVLGTLSAPDAPTGLTAVGDYRSIVLNWINPSSVDLDHIEVLASTINDKDKAQLIAKVSGTTFTHNGLEDSVTWYYWVRAANKRGMLSALNSPLATTATTRDVLSFLKNKITESELGQDLIADIDSKAIAKEVDAAIDEAKSETKAQVDDARTEAANAVKSAKEALSTAIDKETLDRTQAIANETTARNKAIADEASIRATAISNEVTARTNAIAAEVDARTKAVADEATARAKAVSDEAIARASAITDSVAVEASNRAKAVSDATAALDAKISKEARDRASAVSALDIKTANAINTETLNRISSIEDEARARADALLQEKNNRQSEISNLSTQVQTVNESLAQQISQIAAGTGEQFDSLKIWYFDTNSEGWTEDDGGTVPMAVTDDGWLKSSNSTASCRSPNNMVIDANAYRFLKLRIKKVGKPTWSGKLYWIGASEQGWSESRSLVIDEPEYDANGVATLTIHDIDWRASTTIRRFRFDFLKNQSDTNNLLIDWVAVGRPTPGAGMAALQDEKSARVDADAAEAANRNALAVQMRGSYEGNDLSKVGSGLIFQEQLARVTADKAEAMARQSLETKVDDSVSNINKSLDTLNTQDSAMASDITGLKSSLKDKADASALQTLKTSVDQQGSNISTQGQSITKLQNDLSTTNANVSKKADQTALTALQGTVTQQGKDISAANSSITNLKTSLDTTNSNVAKKADATAVNDLTSRVSATEGKVSSQADSIVQLNNSLSNAIADSDVSTKTPNNLIVNPSFERGTDGYIGLSSLSSVITIQVPHSGTKALMVAPGNSAAPGQYVDFVKDRTYEIGVWVKQVSGTTDNGSGNNKLRVGSTAGNPVFELPFTGVSGDWTKFSRRWKATETASLPVTLSNYLTAGNRYFDDFYVIDVTDSVNIDANASALSSLQNTVTQQGKDISSQSTSITSLNNSLKTTNDNVAKKADSSTVQTLQNTVTQQGKDISTATSDISSLKSGLATTDGNVAKKADASALQSLQNTVTQQGKDLTSVGSRTTALENSLKTTNDNVATKADASSLSTLQNTVSQQSKDIASQSDSITSLNNSVGAMTNMGDNLIQDANLEGDGSAFRTQQNSGTTGSIVAFGAYGENSAGARMLKVNATSPGLFANGKKPTPVNGSRKFRYIVRAKGVSGSMNMLLRRWNFNGSAEGNYEDKNVTLTSDWQTITWDTSFSPSTGADGQAFGIYCHPSNAEIWIDSFQVFDITDAVNNDATASALSDLSTKVTKQGDTVSSQGTSITKLQNDLTSTKTDVSKKADASALQTLQNTVTDQGKTLISQGNAITTLTSTVDTVKGDVAKKADATALNNLSTRVSNAEDKISSSSDAITSLNNSLSSTKADADAAKSVAGNMLKNNSFERGFEGWEYVGWTLLAAQSPKSGSYIIQAGKLSSGGDAGCNQTVELEAGKTYRIGAWVRKSSDFAINNAGNNKISLRNADLSAIKDIPITGAGLSTSWTLFSGEYTPTKTASVVVSLRASVASGYMYLDDVFCIDVSNEKAIDATSNALSTLNSTVTQQGKDITSNSNSITSLSNQMVNGRQNMWVRSVYNVQLANNATEPTFSDINGKAPISIDEVPDAAKLDFASAGSYVIAHYKAFVKVNADTTITMAPGSRVFDDTGAVYVNGVRAAFGNSSWNTVSFDLKAGWSTVEFLVNQWTGQAYINLGFKLSEKVAQLNSALGMNALSNAISAVTSNVSTVGDRVTSTSQSVTDLRNSLEQTNANLANKADAQALSTLQNTVSKQGDTISSQGNSITKLTNDLEAADANIAKKADQSAVTTLTGRVEKTESGLTAANSDITSLNSSLNQQSKRGANLLPDGTFESYAVGHNLSNNRVIVTTDDSHGGNKCIRVTRPNDYNANATDNSDNHIFSGFQVRDNAVFYMECWVKLDAKSTAMAENAQISIGLSLQYQDNSWQWPAVTKAAKDLSTAQWTKVSGYLKSTKSGIKQAMVRISIPNVSSVKAGNSFLIDDLVITEVTDAYNAQSTADANANAISTLDSTVSQQGDQITSQGNSITKLTNDLSTTNSNVAKKADGAAVTALTNRVTEAEGNISSQSNQLATLSNSLAEGSLICNGGLNVDASFWEDSGPGSAFTYDANEKAIRTTTGSIRVANLTRIPVEAETTLTISFEMKASEAITNVSSDSVGVIADLATPTNWISSVSPWLGGVSTNWQTKSVELTIPANFIGKYVYLRFAAGGWTPSNSARLYIRKVDVFSSTGVAKKANATAVSDLTSRVDSTEGKLASQSQALTKLQNDLATTNNNVSKKADANALTALTNRVTQTEKDINSTSSSVTNLNNKVDAISVGGTNLIKNSGDMTGWSNVVSDTYRGNAVIGATVKAGSGYKDLREITLESPVDADECVYSFYAKGGVNGQSMTTFFYNPNTTESSETSQGVKASNTDGRAVFTLTTEWVRYWVKWKQKPGTGAKRLIIARIEASTTADQTVYVSAPKMEVGNIPTEWSPAPSDLAASADLSSLQTTVAANSSSIQSVTSRVSNVEGTVSSQGTALTSLQNSLNTTNSNVSKKADASALQTLQNTVTQQGKDITASNANVTSLQASLTRRTVFTITSRGNGSSAKDGIFDESGVKVFAPGRSYALVTFKANSDGSTSIDTSKTYDVFGSANNGKAMSDDIAALANGVYACVMTYDEPAGSRSSVYAAVELLGGTSEVLASLPYRGAYILLGRKGMKAGDGLELRAPTGGDQSAFVSTSVEFVNGVMMGLGAAGGVMMKADANASAITTLQNTVTQQGKDITSSSSAITSLQNGLVAANSNIDKKADATALQSLQNTVTQQGKDISTQSGNVTNLQNSLSATNTGLANLVADSDASKKIIGNLLTNSSFERGLEGFSGGASFIKVIDAQSPNSGSKILSCGAGTGTVSQSIAVTKDRTYKIGAFVRCQSGSVLDNQGNNKLRIGNSVLLADFQFKPADLPTGSTWKEISGMWKATTTGSVDVSINSSLKSGIQYFDDFYFIDITDIVNIDAASNAVASLTSRVTSAEGTVSSHTGSITNLSNSLNSLNNTVSGKADASALQSLQNTVTQQGKDLSSASGSVTDLKSSLNTLKVQSNPWIDGTFETYDNNQQLGGSTAIVTTDFKSSGSKCLKVTRPANTSGNSDKMIGSYSAVRQSAKYRVEFWAMMPASEAPPSGWSVAVGLHSINKDGGNDWQGITFNEAGLGGRDQWVKFTGVVKVSPSVTRSHVWISTRGQSGSNTPGYAVYIDDFVITDITDAADAQATADANATAISSLQTKVSDIDGKVTAQTSQLSSMQSKVDASSSKVDQLSKTISDSQSTQASLNTSLQSQIDAQASANIKNQADLNSATTSIASIKSTQATQATQISAMAKTQTDMTASLNSQSASIQTLQEAVSNNDALNSTWMVKMETNNNGQKYAAGIALGVDGKNMQSQFLVQADRFALINTSNGNTTTPFVIDNGVTYMNAAYIKDGSIGSAKVGDLMSSGFQENVRGWRISRDGTMNINGSGPGSSRTVITNGRIEVYDSNNRLRVRMGIF
ncbi:phage tail protein [Klebsiella michiganensis]|uniref:Phage tail protein n=1 Tax=Klebsiella michiganensis TaxID=1134687 RepID=A0AAJ1KT63_9ENTR|nr:phage tail protein [Klebsiella michiganensis]MDH0964372.1 phage tail protein [Klebsiella michiganensis]